MILWCDERGEFGDADATRLYATGAEVIRVRTKTDLGERPGLPRSSGVLTSVRTPDGTDTLRGRLSQHVAAIARPALAPSQSRCRHHIASCAEHLQAVREHVANDEPPELAASALRAALDQLGEVTGAVYTTDFLDRIFSRFCIGNGFDALGKDAEASRDSSVMLA